VTYLDFQKRVVIVTGRAVASSGLTQNCLRRALDIENRTQGDVHGHRRSHRVLRRFPRTRHTPVETTVTHTHHDDRNTSTAV
jgi:hypothetical protein